MNPSLISKFLQGKCSSEEQQKIRAWSRSPSFEEDLGKLFDQYWQDSDYETHGLIDSEKAYQKIQSQLAGLDQQASLQLQSFPRKKYQWLKYAAVLAIFLLSSYGLFRFFIQTPVPDTIADNEMITKTTGWGQKLTLFLGDGSKVVLNSGSALTFPKNFTDSTRRVKLRGEAYFEVSKDKAKPFSVTADNIVTTALGTSFNIYAQNNEVTISLATGKVMISGGGLKTETKQHILNPGERLSYQKGKAQFVKDLFDYNQTFLWKEGIIYFKDASFEEMVKKLETWYNVKFELSNNPQSIKPYTGEFNNESLENVLESMGFSLDFDYFLNGENVKIIFN